MPVLETSALRDSSAPESTDVLDINCVSRKGLMVRMHLSGIEQSELYSGLCYLMYDILCMSPGCSLNIEAGPKAYVTNSTVIYYNNLKIKS